MLQKWPLVCVAGNGSWNLNLMEVLWQVCYQWFVLLGMDLMKVLLQVSDGRFVLLV